MPSDARNAASVKSERVVLRHAARKEWYDASYLARSDDVPSDLVPLIEALATLAEHPALVVEWLLDTCGASPLLAKLVEQGVLRKIIDNGRYYIARDAEETTDG